MTPEEIQATVDAAVAKALAQAATRRPEPTAPPPMGETTGVQASIAGEALTAVLTGDELAAEDQAEVDEYERWVRGSGPSSEKVDDG